MAEATGLRNNALPYPVYGVPFGITFPLLDADGDPISPSSPDSEVSKNGDTFTDCTNEATEIATSSGICYLLLTASEMSADVVTVKIASTGAKTTVITLYPRKLAVLSSGTCQASNDSGDIKLASNDSAVNDYYNGCLCVATIDSTVEARIINDYVGSTKVAEVSPAWNTGATDTDDTYTIYAPENIPVIPGLLDKMLAYTQLTLRSDAAIATDRATELTAINADQGSGAGSYDNTDAPTVALTSAYNLYRASIEFEVDEANAKDEYTVVFNKNGVECASGDVTSPTIQVIKRADGTDLIASGALTEIGSTGIYKKDATTTSRITAGEAVIVIVSATIDGATRTIKRPLGRDSAA
jgi:hypothetical protein